MPFYTWLRPRNGDSKRELRDKQRTSQRLLELRQALEAHIQSQPVAGGAPIPPETSRVLRLATWNIREFDSNAYGDRLPEAKSYIAEILSHFDLIAVQEVREDLDALLDVMRLLGPDWSYVATDVTQGSSGNHERMAFVYHRGKVWFRNVAGELTLEPGRRVRDPSGERFQVKDGPRLELPGGASLASPTNLKIKTTTGGKKKLDEDVEIPLPEGTRLTVPTGSSVTFAKGAELGFTAAGGIELPTGNPAQLSEEAIIRLPPDSIVGGPLQFARTPFVVAFQAGWLKINLCTVHIYYGEGEKGLARRNEEIRHLTSALADRARSDSDSDADAYFIALGDFNIVGKDHETMESLRTNDFEVPDALTHVPGSNVKKDKAYDQIAIWTGESSRRKTYTRIRTYRAGVFDYFDTVFRTDEESTYHEHMKKKDSDEFYAHYSTWRTYQMSDHLPMWLELHIDFSDSYLESIEREIADRLEA